MNPPPSPLFKNASDPFGGHAGNTALHYSVSVNHLMGMKKLVRYGAKGAANSLNGNPSTNNQAPVVDVPNAAGKTPLHFALESGKVKATAFLLEMRANINLKGI